MRKWGLGAAIYWFRFKAKISCAEKTSKCPKNSRLFISKKRTMVYSFGYSGLKGLIKTAYFTHNLT